MMCYPSTAGEKQRFWKHTTFLAHKICYQLLERFWPMITQSSLIVLKGLLKRSKWRQRIFLITIRNVCTLPFENSKSRTLSMTAHVCFLDIGEHHIRLAHFLANSSKPLEETWRLSRFLRIREQKLKYSWELVMLQTSFGLEQGHL